MWPLIWYKPSPTVKLSELSLVKRYDMSRMRKGVSLLFGHSVMSESLRPHGLQHTRLPCPSLSPAVCSNSCLLSWWCHPPISSSVIPFSCLQPFPASGSFPRSRLCIRWPKYWSSASASVLPKSIQGWFPLGSVWSCFILLLPISEYHILRIKQRNWSTLGE